eukprot:4028443-Pleurochrysis_carterae.AAC.1
MFRLDEDVVQPESKEDAAAYHDPEKAKAQRERWIEEAKEDLEIECDREHFADEPFPEPPPSHPDSEESSDTSASDSDAQAP